MQYLNNAGRMSRYENETGAFLWEKLEHGASEEELLSEMLEAYDVDEQTAKAGVQKFIRELKEAGLLE